MVPISVIFQHESIRLGDKSIPSISRHILDLNQPQNVCYGYNLGNGQIEPDKESLQHKDMLLYTDCQKGCQELAAPSSVVVP